MTVQAQGTLDFPAQGVVLEIGYQRGIAGQVACSDTLRLTQSVVLELGLQCTLGGAPGASVVVIAIDGVQSVSVAAGEWPPQQRTDMTDLL
ncbi:hypothetical protein D3C85_1521920 [compost metagenome]